MRGFEKVFASKKMPAGIRLGSAAVAKQILLAEPLRLKNCHKWFNSFPLEAHYYHLSTKGPLLSYFQLKRTNKFENRFKLSTF